MFRNNVFLAALIAVSAVACTKPAEPGQGAATPAAGVAADAPAVASGKAVAVSLYNAYTARSVGADGIAGEPTKAFKVGDPVYVGAVLHGVAESADVRIEWFKDGDQPLGNEATSLAVREATVATLQIGRDAPLVAGRYKVLVYLDNAPSWELAFDVTD